MPYTIIISYSSSRFRHLRTAVRHVPISDPSSSNVTRHQATSLSCHIHGVDGLLMPLVIFIHMSTFFFRKRFSAIPIMNTRIFLLSYSPSRCLTISYLLFTGVPIITLLLGIFIHAHLAFLKTFSLTLLFLYSPPFGIASGRWILHRICLHAVLIGCLYTVATWHARV